MRIDLSLLIGNAEQYEKFRALGDGKLPSQKKSFEGPFGGLLRIEPTGWPGFAVDGRFVRSIELDPDAARIEVTLPVPLTFRGVRELELHFSYSQAGDAWTVGLKPMAWLEHDKPTDKVEGMLGRWMLGLNGEDHRLEMKGLTSGFPIDDWGLAVPPMQWTRNALEHFINIGVFVDADGRGNLVIVPQANSNSEKTSAPGLNFAGLQDAPLGSLAQGWRVAPLALSFPLHESERTPSWCGVVLWAPVQKSEDRKNDKRLSLARVLEPLWNEPSRRALRGARIEKAALPLVPLPLLSVIGVSDGHSTQTAVPLLFIDAPWNADDDEPGGPRLRRVYLSAKSDTTLRLKADFHLHAPTTSVAPPGLGDPVLTFEGRIDEPLPPVPTSAKPPGDTKEDLRAALDAALKNTRNAAADDLLLSWVVKGSVTAPAGSDGWIVWGSLQFQLPDKNDATQELECRVRGSWTADACDVYPEVSLDLRNCQVRPSASADAADRDLFAAFGAQSGLEDDLQRESDVLRFPRHKVQPSRRCDIRIRHRTDRGRLSVSRVEVRAVDRTPFGDESVVLQLRPFAVAVVQPADIDAEAGELIAVWSSNDPEGVQWRLPDATAMITLPPQAVGEAMERGARFWQQSATGKPWIDPASPIAYRFAPPTQLLLRPSVRERRYNKSPSNVFALMADAKVEAFTTETMYPIQAKFEVSALGLPDIRMRETGSMLGRPAENLPPPVDVNEEKKDSKAKNRWLRGIFASQVAVYASTQSEVQEKVDELRRWQSAAKSSFAARLAEYHVYDPRAANGRLNLSEGLAFRLRDTNWGARPLINPLPGWKVVAGAQEPIVNGDLLVEQRKTIHVDDGVPGPQFLDKGRRDWALEGNPDGAFVGGVVHTMEFPSELVAVLRNPIATRGRIDSLAFTALGANAHMSVAFDEGRTIFVGETSHGQLSRLIKIRIGRVAVLWNRARHVVVYERTTVPSQQFGEEQEIGGVDSRGWPVLRKTAEYVEPLEPVRIFADEAQVKDNRAGFIHASEFITPRIYVNGAWGRDVVHGYEMPLWNETDTSGFYPKPKLAVRAHAGGEELVRCELDEPQHVYFYSNTEPGKGDNSDKWASYRGVDQPLAVPRLKVVTAVPGNPEKGPARQNKILETAKLPGPRLGGLRRPRFDFKVVCDGKVNLQHARGQTEMLGVMDAVTVMRTAAVDSAAECGEGIEKESVDPLWKTELDAVKALSNQASQVVSAKALRAAAQELVEKACGRIATGADCTEVKKALREQIRNLLSKARDNLSEAMGQLPALPDASGLLRRAADELEKELLGIERAIRAPFDMMLADLDALRANANADLVDTRRKAIAQLGSGAQIAKGVIENAVKATQAWATQIEGAIGDEKLSVDSLLLKANAELDELVKAAGLAYDKKNIEEVVRHCDEAIAKLRPLTHHKVYGSVLGRCCDVIVAVRASFRGGAAEEFWNKSKDLLLDAAKQLQGLTVQARLVAAAAAKNAQAIVAGLAGVADGIFAALDAAVVKLESAVGSDIVAVLQQVAGEVEKLHGKAEAGVGKARDDAIGKWRSDFVKPQMDALRDEVLKIETAFAEVLKSALQFSKKIAELMRTLTSAADNWLVQLQAELEGLIDKVDCTAFDKLHAVVQDQLNHIEQQIEDRITGLASSLIDDSTRARFSKLEENIRARVAGVQSISDEVAKGVKLVKALGDLPQLPTLTFNADRAEYVFDDLRQQIETSPFAAKLREIDSGLKELGISIPTEQLLDQIVPSALKDIDFNKIFKNLGAMDFTEFFKRFQLPEIRNDQLQVTHGLDKRTRTAWVSTKIDAQFNEEKDLFEFAGLSVSLAKMDMKATSNLSVGLNGEQDSKTDAKLKADWGLSFSGARLATFREVVISYNGSKFDFDIEPKRVELHPALKFVDEFAKRFQPKMPPGIELLKDSRGIPVGVKAQMHTEVVLPPLGIVEIGPMLISSGLSMRVTPAGKFRVEANVSVGSRDTPVWVQVSYLGGGMWLEARAHYDEGVHYEASVGLALGCIKAFNLASVARGSFAFLLFAYASMSDANGGSMRVGLQVTGNARIVGIANAGLLLLLEAVHGREGTEGRGTLDISIDICWCYTLHVRKDVKHQIN
jgi:hypothetical protein